MSDAREVVLAAECLLAECREFARPQEPKAPEQLYKLPFGSGYVVIGQKTRDMLMYLKGLRGGSGSE